MCFVSGDVVVAADGGKIVDSQLEPGTEGANEGPAKDVRIHDDLHLAICPLLREGQKVAHFSRRGCEVGELSVQE